MIRLALAAAAAVSLLAAGPAGAVTVFDPTNYAQNLLQASRALQQIENQVAALQNQARLLAGQARNLARLDLKAAGALNGDVARVNALLTRAGRLAQDVEGLQAQFQRDYAGGAIGGRALAEAAEARWRNAMDSFRRVLEVQAGVTAGLAATTAQAGALAQASEGAEGALQAAQAGNQLLAVQSKQLADLTALLAAQGQAQALEQAREAAARSDARARLQRFLAR